MNRRTPLLAASLLFACSSADPQPATPEPVQTESHESHHAEHAEAAEAPSPTRTLDDGSRLYGGEPSDIAVTSLAQIMAEPARWEGQTVKTEGEIAQVCQRMGCWMEITAEEGGTAVRVPMAGHSFFLPRDVAGRRATVEGTVKVESLDEATAEHLREEGAQATDQALSIEATSVVVH